MSEFHTDGVHVFEHAQKLKAAAIEAQALQQMGQQYGTGYPSFNAGSEANLAYHNRHHAAAVSEATERMCRALGLSATERAIGRMAAGAHDIVQLKARGIMERESADWLEAKMLETGLFPPAVIEIGVLAILGTEPLFADNRIVGQMVSEQRYPTKSAELIAKSVACADLGELHAPIGPRLGHELYRQITGTQPGQEPPMGNFAKFQRNQLVLADSYVYPHAKGGEVFGGLRGAVVEHHKALLEAFERGDITNFAEVIDRDQAFLALHS